MGFFLVFGSFVCETWQAYGDFNLDWSPRYVERRPLQYPAQKQWPVNNDVFEGLADMTRMKWP